MTDRHDGSSIDMEQALDALHGRAPGLADGSCSSGSRRFGPAAALAPVIAACTVGRAASHRPASTGRHRQRGCVRLGGGLPRSTEPTPVPEPEDELASTTGPSTSARTPSPRSRRSTGSRSSTTSSRTPTRHTRSSATTAAGTTCRSRSRWTSPTSWPRAHSCRSTSRSSRTSRTWARNGSTRSYDPGNNHSVPYMWWTTGVAYDTAKITETLTSSKALWDTRFDKHIAMLDDWQEVFALAPHPAGVSMRTPRTRRSWTPRSPCWSSRSRSCACTAPTPARR